MDNPEEFIMPQVYSSPEEVLHEVSRNLRLQGITHAKAALMLGMKNKQSFSNLLASKKYLSQKQAERFNRFFNYSIDFLTYGRGSLEDFDAYIKGYKDVPRFESDPKTGSSLMVNDTQRGDINHMLDWFLEFFTKQNNRAGLSFWAEIKKFAHANETVLDTMRDYHQDDFDEEYRDRMRNLETEIIKNIRSMIESTVPLG